MVAGTNLQYTRDGAIEIRVSECARPQFLNALTLYALWLKNAEIPAELSDINF